MSHIYIYSPSSAVRDKAAFRRGVARLKVLGHDVEIDEAALCSHLRFAGDDETRLAAIGRAAASGADVALISRGGYGLTRILGGLPYKSLAKAIERGTQFVGLSDFTAFQCAVHAKTGAVTWAGPALGEDFGAEGGPDEIMEACFDDLICGHGEGSGWRLPAGDVPALAALLQQKNKIADNESHELRVSKATLWGGNLTVLCSLVGTPYLPAIKGGILFLEDVNEHPYRIERQLTQLLHAGIVDQQKAVLLGSFNRYQPSPHDRGFKLQTVVKWLRSQTCTPVFTGLPFGHVPTKVLLPVGHQVELMVQGRDALLYWG
ncbi:MAG: LD-carboxypeptidase [Hydrogenophaga sp.]|jgi:muramoyltetrapeptide carboxypeptidase|uniref:LD-carboxypeptidase n=1 Tax=Hydrogenophaga sp. TaxID=1904254 RepID=UPI002726C3F8|nr:LD-carboxypeptidase [Hydrogenophaga sp.]MDO9201823.1 LD-carboxypeptidase [Hydrogenophaga sp.]MDO9482499.1 LD-carboxypeptidase [Hydrogenophaga sp.]MDO9569476.1 LD-carboxypeptidase [Hydrogenophaga sp.]MDP1894201.1 LD-carboxypeptidase [Hydrogenophaga sp.]MDP2093781.1 LD-carboxypeptidase [Hydrogenophaga sp.]